MGNRTQLLLLVVVCSFPSCTLRAHAVPNECLPSMRNIRWSLVLVHKCGIITYSITKSAKLYIANSTFPFVVQKFCIVVIFKKGIFHHCIP